MFSLACMGLKLLSITRYFYVLFSSTVNKSKHCLKIDHKIMQSRAFSEIEKKKEQIYGKIGKVDGELILLIAA